MIELDGAYGQAGAAVLWVAAHFLPIRYDLTEATDGRALVSLQGAGLDAIC